MTRQTPKLEKTHAPAKSVSVEEIAERWCSSCSQDVCLFRMRLNSRYAPIDVETQNDWVRNNCQMPAAPVEGEYDHFYANGNGVECKKYKKLAKLEKLPRDEFRDWLKSLN